MQIIQMDLEEIIVTSQCGLDSEVTTECKSKNEMDKHGQCHSGLKDQTQFKLHNFKLKPVQIKQTLK